MPEPVVQMCLFTTGKKHEADMKSLINTYIYIYNHVYKTSARKPTNFWDRQPIAKKGEVICLLQVHDGLKGFSAQRFLLLESTINTSPCVVFPTLLQGVCLPSTCNIRVQHLYDFLARNNLI